MLTSESVTEATEKSGITKNTAYRYLNDPEWKAEYREQSNAITTELTNQLLQLGTKAIKTLEENLTDEEATPASRNTTAKTILDYIYRSYEQNEIVERIEALEQLLEENE